MSQPEQTEIAGFPALYAKAEGQRRPSPLVFLHGFWATHQFYPTYLPFFSAAGFDCYSVARRGRCGVPPKHARGVRMRDYLKDTLAAIDAIGRDVIVIGWSLGGLVAQQVAEAGRCRAAVLVAPAAPGDIHVLPRLAALPGYLMNLPSILLGSPFLPSFGDASRTLLNRIPSGDRRRLYGTLVPDSGIVGREIALTGVPVDASHVRCPMICLVGLEDNITPARSVRGVARKYGADLREYPDHGHWLPEEPGWDAIARDILAWIEEQDRKCGAF
jgi:pimeloyl-ACP methyl ester carboxylesterase